MNVLRKISKIYPWQIEILPIVLLLLAFYTTFTAYSILPDQVPTHFDIQGLPNGWGSKGELLIYPFSGLFVYALITGISIGLAVTKNPKSLINLPGSIKDKITPEQAERLRIILVRCLLALKILILGQNLYLLDGNIQTAMHKTSGIGETGIFVFTAGIILIVVYMVYQSFKIALSK
jgi:uncharacterized membrane protein